MGPVMHRGLKCKFRQPCWRTPVGFVPGGQLGTIQLLNIYAFDLAIPMLEVFLRDMYTKVCQNACTRMFTATKMSKGRPEK